jgi:uncharacterized damage-inducible protein DinB
MSRTAVEQLLRLMDGAFTGVGESPHSLLANLRSVGEDDWDWHPPGGHRTIFDIVRHVGECYYVYDSHALSDGTMNWDTVPTVEEGTATRALLDWLREGHHRFREHVAALTDEDLARPGRIAWHEGKDLQSIIALMIEHDLYHAGEINHIRALCQGNDGWNPESPWAHPPAPDA